MRDFLVVMGITIGVKRTRRLMRKMAIDPLYPKPKLRRAKYVPLPSEMYVDIPHGTGMEHRYNQYTDYIPMPMGFLYLYAINDVYSRKIVSWGLFTILEAGNASEVLHRTIEEQDKPEIINSDQGSLYTCRK